MKDLKELSKPFPQETINWKPQTISKEGNRALAVAYIDARDVAQRLDDVVGAGGWQVDHKQVGDQTLTGIGIRVEAPSAAGSDMMINQWIWKWDIGIVDRENDEVMSAKGSLSDGLKRAAVLWGIGRYLYSLPKTWVGFDKEKRRLTETPALPAWALPEGTKAKPPDPVTDEAKPNGKKTPVGTTEDAKLAYRQVLGRAKLTDDEGRAILSECGGDLDLARQKVAAQYLKEKPF